MRPFRPICSRTNTAAWNLVLLVLLTSGVPADIVSVFRDGENFQKLLLHEETGSVFLGAENRLYRLSLDLIKRQRLSLGPDMDSYDCLDPQDECSSEKTLRDMRVKVLLAAPDSTELLLCGNLFQGSCAKIAIQNITSVDWTYKPVVGVKSDALYSSTAAVITEDGLLFIGNSVNKFNASYPQLTPFLATRNYTSLGIQYRSGSQSSQMNIRWDLNFKAVHRYAFSYSNSAYFLATEEARSDSRELATFLGRTCLTDHAYRSYVEAQLHCEIDGLQLNSVEDAYVSAPGQHLARELGLLEQEELLFVAFSKTPQNTKDRSPHSGLCVYRLADVHENLTNAMQTCFKGRGDTGPFHLARPTMCMATNLLIRNNYCGEHLYNNPIRSTRGLYPILSRVFSHTHLSSVAVSTVGPHTLVYMGTRKGDVLKVEVQNRQSITYYDKIPVHPGHAILPDMHLSSNGTFLYAITSSKAVRVKTLNCDRHVTCDTCMTSADPHCGWCAYTNRCTSQRSCGGDLTGWTRTRVGPCAAILRVEPELSHVNTPIKLNLTLTVAPSHGAEMKCSVHMPTRTVDTEARLVGSNMLHCSSAERWPQLPHNEVSGEVEVDVMLGGKAWLSTSATIYDCSRHDRCGECVTGSNPCAWCISSGRCTDASTVHLVENCGLENFIYPAQFAAVRQSSSRGRHTCPRIEALDKEEPLLHSGIAGTVRVAGYHLPPEIHKESVYCQLGEQQVGGAMSPRQLGFLITCEVTKFTHKRDVPFESIPISILWGQKKTPLDNPFNLQLKLYDCEHLATSCGQCLTLDPRFRCGQCEGHCSLRERCPTTWHDHTYVCHNPLITRVQPQSGPRGGGTSLTIHGLNLGQEISHVTSGVSVGGEPCRIVDYTPSTSIVCITPAMTRHREAQIAVTVARNFTAHAETPYIYADPVLETVVPERGPVAGGTNVTVKGRYLDVGTSLQVSLLVLRHKRQAPVVPVQKSVDAFVHRRTNESVEFETRALEGSGSGKLQVVLSVDGNKFSDDALTFSYAENPTITKVQPAVVLLSGGTLVTVSGSSLDLIQRPRLVVYAGDQQRVTSCELITNQTDVMTCVTPALTDLDLGNSADVTLNYGFVMDNVTQLLNVSTPGRPGLDRLVVYPDPVLDSLPDDTEYDIEKPLTLFGSHLGVLRTFPASCVMVGGARCNVTVVNDTAITCLPTAQPQWLNAGQAKVTLKVQSYVTSPVWIRVKGARSSSFGLPGILAIVAGAIILVAFILTCCLCRRRNKDNKDKAPANGIEDPAAIPLNNVTTQLGDQPVVETEVVMTEATPLTVGEGDAAMSEQEKEAVAESRNNYVSGIAGVTLASPDAATSEGRDDDKLRRSLLKDVTDAKLRETIYAVLIPQSHLTLGDVLGKGHFGCVYSGTLKSPDKDEEPVKVAVKTLQGAQLTCEAVESFLREGLMMKNFDHPHVLRLLGVSVTDGGKSPLVVLPYMVKGDLRNYVKNKNQSFTARQLLHLGQQVAQGMAYLAQRGFIHRDLAARNCMVDEDSQVKVADFGLSKDLYEKDYFSSVDRKRKMPIKWMALESLEDYVFTTKSDVWSFGVLLWELMIRGVTPYPDVDAFEMRNYLASGRRLRQPKFCPDNAYKLMAECWRTNPDDRPTFTDLVNRLELIVNPPRKNEYDAAGDEPLYVNIQRQPSLPSELEPEDT